MPSDTEDEAHATPRTPTQSEGHANGRDADESVPRTPISDDESSDEDAEVEDDDDEDQDDEPKLKYNRLTERLSPVYRNGDSTSSFLVSGDKVVIGTHNGNINVLALPSFQPLRVYHAHSASITAVSISPFPLPFPHARREIGSRTVSSSEVPSNSPGPRTPAKSIAPTTSPRTPRLPPVPATPSNHVYIATSSMDGHVCIASLIDQKDVMLRNFSRPVNAVALSPQFRSDRSYLSGGLAGNLILTSGGKSGVSSNANTNSAAAAASGWLSSIGIGSNTGKDSVLHSGEGSISTIKWSLSGKFVVWVNEEGIKIMRSNLKLDTRESENAWKRFAHVDRPTRANWKDMAAVWKARAEWIDEAGLETDEDDVPSSNGTPFPPPSIAAAALGQIAKQDASTPTNSRIERLVVGWGDAAWVLHVKSDSSSPSKSPGQRSAGTASIVHRLILDDCIISGVSLYTPSLLLTLAYRTRDDENATASSPSANSTPRRGVHHRQNGLSPELRLINMVTKEEVDVDTLTMSRYESLSAADYHLSTLHVPPAPIAAPVQRGALDAITGLWDMTINPTRIFSSTASIKSGSGSGDNTVVSPPSMRQIATTKRAIEAHPDAAGPGLKIFIQSPYDCVLAVKRDLIDHLAWLLDHEKYKDAWELVTEHPEVVLVTQAPSITEDAPSTPAKGGQSLADFFADETASQTTVSGSKAHKAVVEKEKRRIGDLWIQQLVAAKDWTTGGQIAGRVLGASPRWEHWVWTFAQANKFDEITPYIPTKPLSPPIPSLVYELVLGHYLVRDRPRFRELIEAWDPSLFAIGSITTAIDNLLSSGDVREDSVEDGVHGRDWRMLLESLAKLHLADGHPKKALHYQIRLQNADAVLRLIAEYHLSGAVSDDIPGLLTLRVPKGNLSSTPLAELEDASADGIQMLVVEAYQGTVKPLAVVAQLDEKGPPYRPFLYLYFRALWKGHGTETHRKRIHQQLQSEGRVLVEEFGDLAVSLFADHDRDLFMEFLRGSRSYSFEKASTICESKSFWPELVFLLSQTGQLKRALDLIINRLGDPSLAISFAKEQDDRELWDDLLEYSMDKPRFIRSLLEEVGTALDPQKLVQSIPDGLEIEGLRDGIGKIVREVEIQKSISEGVARVLRGEVTTRMEILRKGRERGVKFDVIGGEDNTDGAVETASIKTAKTEKTTSSSKTALAAAQPTPKPTHPSPAVPQAQDHQPGHCAECGKPVISSERDTLIGFPCGHVQHLGCLLDSIDDNALTATVRRALGTATGDGDDAPGTAGAGERSVASKVARVHIVKMVVGRGCPVCRARGVEE